MQRAPKKAYLIYWRRPNGRNRKKKLYVQRNSVGPWLERLAEQSCTDVHVLEGELIDVSADFLPKHFDAVTEVIAEKRAHWVGESDFRGVIAQHGQHADWLITHQRVDRRASVLP